MGGKKEWEKALRQLIYQRWLERWYSQVYSLPLELYCLMIKISTLDFLRAVWEPGLKTARDFSQWLAPLSQTSLLCILFCVPMALCLGTVKRDGNLLSLLLFFFSFANVHTKVLPSVVHNWHIYFMTKEAEEFKAIFPNLTSVSEEADFQANSGQIQLPSTMMSVGVFWWIREFEAGGDL